MNLTLCVLLPHDTLVGHRCVVVFPMIDPQGMQRVFLLRLYGWVLRLLR